MTSAGTRMPLWSSKPTLARPSPADGVSVPTTCPFCLGVCRAQPAATTGAHPRLAHDADCDVTLGGSVVGLIDRFSEGGMTW